jgi:hypothetical protein
MKRTSLTAAIAFILVATVFAAESATKQTVYIEPQQGFESYLAAAMQKKDVPADVVMDKSKAQYWLTVAPIVVHKESAGGKIARCLFAYCVGIEDRGNVSVQLVESGSTKVVWAYSVNKGRGQKNTQSMAEAIAKHLKEYLEKPVK